MIARAHEKIRTFNFIKLQRKYFIIGHFESHCCRIHVEIKRRKNAGIIKSIHHLWICAWTLKNKLLQSRMSEAMCDFCWNFYTQSHSKACWKKTHKKQIRMRTKRKHREREKKGEKAETLCDTTVKIHIIISLTLEFYILFIYLLSRSTLRFICILITSHLFAPSHTTLCM